MKKPTAKTYPTRKDICDALDDYDKSSLLADGFDAAFLGFFPDDGCEENEVRAVYSMAMCLEILMDQGMDRDEAIEYFDFNVACAYVGPLTPLFIANPLHQWKTRNSPRRPKCSTAKSSRSSTATSKKRT